VLHNNEIIDSLSREASIVVAQKKRAEGEARLIEVNSEEIRSLVNYLQKKYNNIQHGLKNQKGLIQRLQVLSCQMNDICCGVDIDASLDVLQKICDEVEKTAREYEALKVKIKIPELIESVGILKNELESIKEGAPKNYLYLVDETTTLRSQLVQLRLLAGELQTENYNYLLQERHAKEDSVRQARLQALMQAEQRKAEEETLLVNQLLDILDDVFSKQNSQNFWNKQVKFKFGAYLCGSQVNVSTTLEPHMISVPRGVCGARNALDMRGSAVSPQVILKDIYCRVDARLDKSYTNQDKPTEVLYYQITQFIDKAGQVDITQEKVDNFLTFIMNDAKFKSLVIKEYVHSKNLVT